MDVAHDVDFTLFLLCFAVISCASTAGVKNNVWVGAKFASYENYDGTIATGNCCDQPGKTAGSCSANMCDTAFSTCGTRKPTIPCDIFKHTLTPVTYNSNKFNFGNFIGQGSKRISKFFNAFIPYDNKPINLVIKAVEAPDKGKTGTNTDIAEFNFTINWVDPICNIPPTFRKLVVKDTRAELVMDVFSQCNRNYYTANCSVFCQPQPGKYTCLQDGTKKCVPGWKSPICAPKTTPTPTTTPTTVPKSGGDNNGGASTGLIVGVSIASLLVAGAVGGIVVYSVIAVKKKTKVSQGASCGSLKIMQK